MRSVMRVRTLRNPLCKRKSATVEFIGVKIEPPKYNIPIVKEDKYFKNEPIVDEVKLNENMFAIPSMAMYASEDSGSESDKENENPQLQILVEDVKEPVNVEYKSDKKDEMGKIEERLVRKV